MRATNQNWWLDWYLYCILEDVFGMMRISTWPVFFKYSSPLTTSSCFSSFSPSIKVSLVPIHIYPPFFHTSCIFQQIFQQIFLRPIPGCIPNTNHPIIPAQAEGSGLPSPQLPMPSERRLDDWGRTNSPAKSVNLWMDIAFNGITPQNPHVFCCICCIQKMTEV